MANRQTLIEQKIVLTAIRLGVKRLTEEKITLAAIRMGAKILKNQRPERSQQKRRGKRRLQ